MNAELPLSIRGARQFNLKNIDLDLPHNSLIVLCGPSGSGKSTLAVDTLFAESRRRFLDCLSSKIRQSMTQPEKPEVDSITGLPPALCLEQSPGMYGPRSLLGNITEIIDYLRVLYSAIGIPHDPRTGRELVRMTPDSISDALLANPEGTRLVLMAPVSPTLFSNREEIASTLRDFLRQGFLRVMWDDDIRDIDDILSSNGNGTPEKLNLVIDRIVLRGEESSARLADSMQTALRINPDEIQALLHPRENVERLESFYTRYRNPETGFVLPHLTPKHFSFNSPQGFCPVCQGMGTVEKHPSQGKMKKGAICPECAGMRLNPIARAVTLRTRQGENFSLPELTNISLEDFSHLIDRLEIPPLMEPAVRQLKGEIEKRAGFLESLGLGYLALSRPASTLSGGELQRARLASQLGGGLSGVLYILDEPTIGLHPEDTARLIQALKQLRDLGNTVLVIEHDEQLLKEADCLVDMGPGSGPQGGTILFQGTPGETMQNSDSITGPWLSGKLEMPRDKRNSSATCACGILLKGAHAHNLKNVDLEIPSGMLTCLSGPSGSGKSTLVMDCLIPALKTEKDHAGATWTSMEGFDSFSRFVLIDQSPIGQSPRSTPATATGLLNILRPLFANLPLSRQRGYTASRFSTNVRGGRCERCLGTGFIEVDMQFLSNVLVPCDACYGQRYNRETLEVTWRGKSMAQLLALSIDDALEILSPIPRAAAILKSMQRVGLGYMALDRPANTLSGGEAQRVKIATELARIPEHPGPLPPSLFILDEPTTGLHFQEVAMLIQALSDLRNAGHAILCIEHNLDMLAASDQLIDMGPGAGKNGGMIVDRGTPAEVASRNLSPTAPWLRSHIKIIP